jgi:hypothetical protein
MSDPDTVLSESEMVISIFSGVDIGSAQSMALSKAKLEEATLLTLRRLGVQAEAMVWGIAALAKGETGEMLKLAAWELLGLVRGAVSTNPANVREPW